jgi:hypothetical protein
MAHISVQEHLMAMTEEKTQPWLPELGQILRDLGDTDSALAASLAYDLSRNHTITQGLRELIYGYQIVKEEMNIDGLAIIQSQTVNNTIKSISTNLDQLSNSSFWRALIKLVQKLREAQCIAEAEKMAKRIRYWPVQIITKLREAEVYLSQGKTVGQTCKSLEISEQTYYYCLVLAEWAPGQRKLEADAGSVFYEEDFI